MNDAVWIDGSWRRGSGDVFQNYCPATGDVAWEGASATAGDVHDAVESARRAFHGWSRMPQSERTAILEAYADEIGKRTDAIAEAISKDMGKALWESRGEAATMKAKVAVSIAAQVERAGGKVQEAAFGSMHLTHRAHGVMAVYGPFNFPGHLPNGHIVPALLAGNTCVFKPSELGPSVAAIMADAFAAAGLPAGVLNIVQGGRETGGALLNADINGLLFTGSANTGVFFHKHFAGRPEVILALEMGGNNPLIIWDPADVDAAADIAAQSAFLTTGQRCSCARRVILPEGAFGDAVIEAIVARAKGLKIGAWDEDDIFMGPLVSEQAATNAVEFQMMLSKKGGQSLRRLKRMDRGGGFVTAGVIDVTNATDIPDEELFGPLMQIIRVPDFNSALERANATRYGLSGGLISDDDALWIQAHSEMRAGILNRNRPTAGASGAMPFGGPGLSGNFRPGAYYAADYSAWPQASQVSQTATRMTAQGFPK
ncbi:MULTISPECIES: succinylglutamate-semialdehyde dehydrogenase [unclassified Hyphomonas]|uniref:succinylglutamate-semialdehyde dehydrogenase n=7 Tax=Hyphomonas TaxID=85 RepID=UPI000C3D2229|nr:MULTISPECIES: succinylglutamate-semialdehyde dehydrogenase [unclassified Hyphomonas]MAL47748.1 succinylglutamate-semialdehyde dehydrogenase [Hyphomonas sp.]MAX85121.1 succinylglutamate-semialdehyde dehydrogenase [Hyphomonas sp.]HBJ41512.1 succinylglutamate-semialdehyde dehydrogenase [Hyphomonas sp.]HBX93085.1 succinylglutamate-semialdehyde dehydrogenase [Hyphomonas sp.]HCE24901.1 succinylglutamate-semialdehyde dehydrogenase [Hyphomonas sp.]